MNMNMNMMNTQSPDTTPRAESFGSFDSCTTMTFNSPSSLFEDLEDALMTPLAGPGHATMADRFGMCTEPSYESFELALESNSNLSFEGLKRYVEADDDSLEDYQDSVSTVVWNDEAGSESSFATAMESILSLDDDEEDEETFWTACDSLESLSASCEMSGYEDSVMDDLLAPLFSTPTTEIPEVVCPDLEVYIDSDSLAEFEWRSTGLQNIPPLDPRCGWNFVEGETYYEEDDSSKYVEEHGWESKNRYVLPEKLSVIYEEELPEMIGLGLELVRMTSSNVGVMVVTEKIPAKFSGIYSFL